MSQSIRFADPDDDDIVITVRTDLLLGVKPVIPQEVISFLGEVSSDMNNGLYLRPRVMVNLGNNLDVQLYREQVMQRRAAIQKKKAN